MIPYYTPGSEELVEAVAKEGHAMAMLMERHGALTQGKTLEEAYDRMEELEFLANLQMIARGAEDLPIDEIRKLEGMR